MNKRRPVKNKLKAALIVLLMLVIVFVGYVEIVNRNSKGMTYRQKVLKAIYPAWMWWAKLTGTNAAELKGNKKPIMSFYELTHQLNDGTTLDFSTLKNKKVMLVNTASNCGYTDQYADLQTLSEQNTSDLVVLAFPANDFKDQEKGSDEEIAAFCKLNYGVTFPIMIKSTVIKSADQNTVFRWLTDSSLNGWNNELPTWNFSKYLVNEKGELTHFFGPSVSPLSSEIKEAIAE